MCKARNSAALFASGNASARTAGFTRSLPAQLAARLTVLRLEIFPEPFALLSKRELEERK